jgi:hypothetical protein
MIRKLVEALERAQLELQEAQHEIREERKKNKDLQTLLEEMVCPSPSFATNIRAPKPGNKKKA